MNPFRRAVPFAIATTLGLAAARAQCDLTALPGDPLRELRGHVDALATFDPDGAGPLPLHLVAGGSFDAGNVVNENVVMWNGTAWVNTNPPFGAVTAMIVWNNLLVAASEEVLWTFDGTTWSVLAGGEEGSPSAPLPGVINALALWNGDLVVGGRFTRITAPFVSVNATHVAKLSASTGWSAFGPGPTTTGMTGANVRALAVFNNTVWLGLGCNTNFSNTQTLQNWNGSGWVGYGAWTDPIDALATRIGTSINTSWLFLAAHSLITPTFSAAGFNPVLGTSTTFAPPPAAGVSRIEQIFVRGTGITTYEVACAITTNGNDKVWKWTAAGGWVALPNLTDSAGAITATRVNFFGGRYVAGLRCAAGSPRGLRFHDATASQWTSFVGGGFDQQVECVCRDGSELVIGGLFTTIEGTSCNRIARGRANQWAPLGPGFSGWVYTVARMPNGDLVAGGAFTSLGDGTPCSHIARWNGTSWSPLGAGVDGDVYALLPMPNGDVFVGGHFVTAGGQVANGIARWTGSTWQTLGSGLLWVNALLQRANGDIVAGGAFGGNIAKWNGSTWVPIGNGFDSVVHALAEMDGVLVAGGEFTTSAGVSMPHVAKLTGTTWAPLDPVAAPTAPIVALTALPGGGVAVGGAEFALAVPGGPLVTCAAMWRGAWSSLDVRGAGVAEFSVGDDGSLALVGPFSYARGVVSSNVARIDTSCPASATTFAPGCPSSGGANTLAAVTLPWANGTLRTRGTGLPANAIVLTLTSVTGISPGVPLSALLPEGVVGCNLLVAPDILAASPAVAGTATSDLFLPNTPPIVGVTFHQQMLPIEFDIVTGAWIAITATNALQLVGGFF